MAIKYAARSRRMNLANRLDDLARKKAELEAGEGSDDDFQQADWPVRQPNMLQPRRLGQAPRTASRQTEQMEEGEEEEEEMEENGMDDEIEEDEQQISSKQAFFLHCGVWLLSNHTNYVYT